VSRAFVIRPFGTKKDSAGNEIDFEKVQSDLIAPALAQAGLAGSTTGEIVEPGNIREDMFALIIEADIVLCDITVHNANVFYELGIRHGLRKKHTVLIKGGPTKDSPPFDILTDRYLPYEIADPAAAVSALVEMIRAAQNSDRDTDSPVFKMLPGLSGADPTEIQVLPVDFREEVARAAAAGSAGWLRLLAGEVRGRRFEAPGLRLVGDAQLKLNDYPGARETWEAVREDAPDDIPANLALANIYERLSRGTDDPVLLERSGQAIDRALGNKALSGDQRAEALGQRGRNKKTQWRRQFQDVSDLQDRRTRATNRQLCDAYEAYRDTFRGNLNSYWTGLAALQMGTVLGELSALDDWNDMFATDQEARSYKETLDEELVSLRYVVEASVTSALAREKPGSDGHIWAEISSADLLFLCSDRVPRVVKAYEDAVPTTKSFYWDAARGQLELFRDLGIRAEGARQVIETMEPRIPKDEKPKPLHVVVFVGHRIDDGRAENRFPADAEDKARNLIREKLTELVDTAYRTEVFASAAPGADILFHEECRSLDRPDLVRTVCLPMPRNTFSSRVFGELDGWRARFLDLVRESTTLELSDQDGLPRWLRDTGMDPWERGNRWVLEMARTRSAANVTLLALWDGKPHGDAPGGTAHMIEMAREAGDVMVVTIDAKELLDESTVAQGGTPE